MVVNVHEAKTHLSRLLKQVALGDTVVIARDGVPVAKLMPIVADAPERLPELSKGLWTYSDDWDSPETNALIADLFYKPAEFAESVGSNAVIQIGEAKPIYPAKIASQKAKPRVAKRTTKRSS